jgi:adenylate cyclase
MAQSDRLEKFWQQLTPMRIALIVGLLLSALRFEGCLYLHLTDRRAMDYRMLQRGTLEPGSEVAIAAIDDESIDRVGRWPWPRSVLARLIEKISDQQPAVIGFDVVFSEPSNFSEQEGLSARPEGVPQATWEEVQQTLRRQDEALAEAIGRSKHVVLGYFFEDIDVPADRRSAENKQRSPAEKVQAGVAFSSYNLVRGKPPESGGRIPIAYRVRANLHEFSEAARGAGYFDVIPDAGDGYIRRVPLVIHYGSDMTLPLSMAMLRIYRPDAPLAIQVEPFGVESIHFGSTEIPVSEDGQLMINYRGPGRTFPHVSAIRVLEDQVPPDTFRDKLVVLGVTATAVQDIRVTPFDSVFPGTEIHANVIDNVLRGDFVHQPDWLVLVDIAALLGLALVIGFGMRYLRGVAAAVAVVVLTAAYLAGSQQVFVTYGLPLTIVYALLSITITYASVSVQHYVTEEREKRKVRKALELYLSPSMARIVSEQPERLGLGGEKRELTVFFSDIRGFTTISEALAPEALVELLNVYLGEMTEIIFGHDGMLDKYIGDAVMAVWGAPLPQPDHAVRACQATLDMVRKLRELNLEWQPRGWPRLDIGIGLNTGPMVFGNMGSAQHLSLTVMGDNVNLGSRLESLNKLYGTNIIASEATVREAGPAFVTREVDLVRVKGKLLPVRIFEVLGGASEREEWASIVERFNAGLEAFRERRWEEARTSFGAILAERPSDGPSRLYLVRCDAMTQTPPGPEWDGVTVMDTK